MPLSSNRRIVVTMMIVMVIVAVLGTVTVILLLQQGTATEALRRSSQRGECRARITNRIEDGFHHDSATMWANTAELVRAANAGDHATARVTVEAMRVLASEMTNREPIQQAIDRLCPAPLVREKP